MRIRAVIFDWAGTVVDYGCQAPVVVLEQIFAKRGVQLEPSESRHAMGLLKLDQIRQILRLPRVAMAWRHANRHEPDEPDVRALFESFIPVQADCIEEYSNVIEGVPELIEKLRSAGVRIGSTTGYTRFMLSRLLPKAARQGYAPDSVVTPDDTGEGRPAPWMIFENMKRLGVYPPSVCVKVGDTPSDIQEGLNAGAVTIGVSDSSSEAALHGAARARVTLVNHGAHRVIGTASDLWQILEEL
jgi:phosphonoacetaldehyde hydrolase